MNNQRYHKKYLSYKQKYKCLKNLYKGGEELSDIMRDQLKDNSNLVNKMKNIEKGRYASKKTNKVNLISREDIPELRRKKRDLSRRRANYEFNRSDFLDSIKKDNNKSTERYLEQMERDNEILKEQLARIQKLTRNY